MGEVSLPRIPNLSFDNGKAHRFPGILETAVTISMAETCGDFGASASQAHPSLGVPRTHPFDTLGAPRSSNYVYRTSGVHPTRPSRDTVMRRALERGQSGRDLSPRRTRCGSSRPRPSTGIPIVVAVAMGFLPRRGQGRGAAKAWMESSWTFSRTAHRMARG